jgi:ribonuclease VapC
MFVLLKRLSSAEIELMADVEQGRAARAAFSRFGKGRRRAGLNYGDCFAYALAKVLGEPLLCKVEDFVHMDVTLVAGTGASA